VCSIGGTWQSPIAVASVNVMLNEKWSTISGANRNQPCVVTATNWRSNKRPTVHRHGRQTLTNLAAALATNGRTDFVRSTVATTGERCNSANSALSTAANLSLVIEGLPSEPNPATSEVGICFHLSAAIHLGDLPAPFCEGQNIIHVRIPQPSVKWLISSAQLDWLAETTVEAFENLGLAFPNAERWHLFYAGSAPGAVKIGQQINPTMSPPAQLYEFSKSSAPRYRPSVVLTSA
jgi:hypothetical protein